MILYSLIVVWGQVDLCILFSWWYFAEPGDYVAREGEPVDGLCIILDGQVLVRLVLASLIHGDTFL